MSIFKSILVFVVVLVGLPAHAQICLVSDVFSSCEGDDCDPDFEDTSSNGNNTTSNVTLGARRVQVRAGPTAVQNAATGVIGFRFRSAYTMDVDFLIHGGILGVIQGGPLPTTFGRINVRGGIRNLTAGTVDEVEIFDVTENESQVTLIPQAPLQILSHQFTSSLNRGDEYLVYFRVEARSRGVLGNSDFASGSRGITFDKLQITFPIPDSDGDGLLDEWEINGIPGCNDNEILVDLPSMGADPDHKDIFIEYDWLAGRTPVASTVAAVKAAFANAPIDAGGVSNPDGQPGINVWIDTGDPSTGDDLGGGNLIPVGDIPNGVSVGKLGGDADADGVADFYQVKAANFDPNRKYAFHYAISGRAGTREQGAGASSCSDGVDNDGDGLIDDEDSGDCFNNSQAELGGNDFFLNVLGSGIFMHELGHNLNLQHGGFEERNCKPNYISVMNYSFQNGIPQNSITGQDVDADGTADNRIIDFSPPRFPGGRGTVPNVDLDEIFEDGLNGSGLDETIILDPSDPENMTRFIDATGASRTMALNGRLDWSGDDTSATDTPDDIGVTANVNIGPSSACGGSPLDVTPHQPHDDWSVVQLNFLQYGDAENSAVNPTTEPEPTPAQIDELTRLLYTTDLAITKTVDPNPWVAGQEVSITLNVENLGPNHTQEVHVTDALPDELTGLNLPSNCTLDNANIVACDIGRLRNGETASVTFGARITPDLTCRGDNQFAFISNTAEVINGAGNDPVRRNNSDTVRMQALCVNYEYATKLICGTQEDPETLRLMQGRYGTTVNIHNPNDPDAYFFKKLALAFPPKEQEPGKVLPISVDRLAYDESLKTDCDELRDRLFGGSFPQGYIEGHLVVQSARPLDVQGVYTAAPLEGGVSTIDVEYVPEREIRRDVDQGPDLVIDENTNLNIDCNGSRTSQICNFRLGYTVRNIGNALAGMSSTRISAPNFEQILPVGTTIAPNASVPAIVSGDFIISVASGDMREICIAADRPADEVEETEEGNNQHCVSF